MIKERRVFKYSGRDTYSMFDSMVVGESILVVYDGYRRKTGLSVACHRYSSDTGKLIILKSWTSHLAVLERVS